MVNLGVGALKNDTPDLSYSQHFEIVSRHNECTCLLASVCSIGLP